MTPPIPEFDEIETKLATHLVDGYADYANLAGNPDEIKSLLDGWAERDQRHPQDQRPLRRQLTTRSAGAAVPAAPAVIS